MVTGAPAAKESAAPGKSWIVHDADGSVEEYIPGKPVVIKAPTAAAPAPAPGAPPMMIGATLGGQNMAISLDDFFRLDEYKERKQRDRESHETKQDIAKGFKDLIKKGASALENMSGDDAEEKEEDK